MNELGKLFARSALLALAYAFLSEVLGIAIMDVFWVGISVIVVTRFSDEFMPYKVQKGKK